MTAEFRHARFCPSQNVEEKISSHIFCNAIEQTQATDKKIRLLTFNKQDSTLRKMLRRKLAVIFFVTLQNKPVLPILPQLLQPRFLLRYATLQPIMPLLVMNRLINMIRLMRMPILHPCGILFLLMIYIPA